MPEEINRIILDNFSDILFSPTMTGTTNLNENGIHNNVFPVGDVMLDSITYYRKLIENKSRILKELSIDKEPYLLLTLHREANTDNEKRLKNILNALSSVPFVVIFPIHPRTKQRIKSYNIDLPENIQEISPAGYFEFIRMMFHSEKLLTDSGGAQKQAFFLSKPCITLRSNTEWEETIVNGWNILVDDNQEKIIEAISRFNPQGSPDLSLFGNGDSSRKIIDVVVSQI